MTPQRTFRPWLALAAFWLALAAGCGPGVGGTGTGSALPDDPSLADFGAVAAPLCSADIAAALPCSVAAGTAEIRFVDLATGGQARLLLQGNRAELDARCLRLVFSGEWGTTSAAEARFFGSLLADGALAREPAQLALQPGSAGAPLAMRLLAGDGSPLTDWLPLRAAAAGDPPAAACP
jgi:hypothetical protein